MCVFQTNYPWNSPEMKQLKMSYVFLFSLVKMMNLCYINVVSRRLFGNWTLYLRSCWRCSACQMKKANLLNGIPYIPYFHVKKSLGLITYLNDSLAGKSHSDIYWFMLGLYRCAARPYSVMKLRWPRTNNDQGHIITKDKQFPRTHMTKDTQ